MHRPFAEQQPGGGRAGQFIQVALVLGVPAILLAYGYVIWHKGFGPEDRVLFRRGGTS